jgi:4-hydroxythreonine-4-phosphate dehydrogenase
MMLAGPALRVVPITGHIPLREVAERITVGSVARAIQATARGLVDLFGIQRPSIALAALNPHAGEAGMLGSEEHDLLVPGLERAARELAGSNLHVQLQGPVPADSLFVDPTAFDAVVCCYHDQAMIPLKMLNRDEAVNITLGLPIVRTSPAHGSALDIAGRGKARSQSMVAALRLAGELARSAS